jgi:metal-responsive CopG/Arc/MetJ family transcriptional regulator
MQDDRTIFSVALNVLLSVLLTFQRSVDFAIRRLARRKINQQDAQQDAFYGPIVLLFPNKTQQFQQQIYSARRARRRIIMLHIHTPAHTPAHMCACSPKLSEMRLARLADRSGA